MTVQCYFSPNGWALITAVEIQTWRDGYGMVEDQIIWITTAAGDVFGRSLLKDEPAASVKAYYLKRGCIDRDCALFWSAAEVAEKKALADAEV
jgi:hypothetical protein